MQFIIIWYTDEGARNRYYIDGRRVTRDVFETHRSACRRLDCLHTVRDRSGRFYRHYSCGRN